MKKAILIVSFGTTYPETRQKNIAAITRQVRALYPDVLVAEGCIQYNCKKCDEKAGTH